MNEWVLLAASIGALAVLVLYFMYIYSFYKSLKNYRERKLILKIIDVLYWIILLFGFISMLISGSPKGAMNLAISKIVYDFFVVYFGTLISDKRNNVPRTGVKKFLDIVLFIFVIFAKIMILVMWHSAKAEYRSS